MDCAADHTICNKCVNGFFINAAGSCQVDLSVPSGVCPTGQGWTTLDATYTCAACPDNCDYCFEDIHTPGTLICTYPSDGKLTTKKAGTEPPFTYTLECGLGFSLNTDDALNQFCEVDGAFDPVCPVGQHNSGTAEEPVCQDCSENCLVCDDTNVCQACRLPFVLNTETNECICEGSLGFFYDESTSVCRSCPVNNCAECEGGNTCSRCLPGFFQNSEGDCQRITRSISTGFAFAFNSQT
jgi:hypothetical protein